MLAVVGRVDRAARLPTGRPQVTLDGEAVLSSWQESFDASPWDGPAGLGARRFAAGQLVLRVLMRPLDVYRGEDGSYRFEACASADPESVEATLEVSSGCWRDSGGVDR